MLETLGGASGFPCYEWALLHALDQEAEDETEVLSPQVWRIEGPLPLGTDGLGVRIHASLREGDEENELYADIITFAAGHAMVSLTAVGLSDPVNQDVEAALALQLLERAERHPL